MGHQVPAPWCLFVYWRWNLVILFSISPNFSLVATWMYSIPSYRNDSGSEYNYFRLSCVWRSHSPDISHICAGYAIVSPTIILGIVSVNILISGYEIQMTSQWFCGIYDPMEGHLLRDLRPHGGQCGSVSAGSIMVLFSVLVHLMGS